MTEHFDIEKRLFPSNSSTKYCSVDILFT